MEKEKLLTAKEFAKLAETTVRTVKYYEEVGIFFPAKTEKNGYRYYTKYQLDDFWNIQILKECGMKLEEIRAYLKNPSFERKQEILGLQQQKLLQRMQKEKKVCDLIRVQQLMMNLAKEHTYSGTWEIELPLYGYELEDMEQKDVVMIQTFQNESMHGVYTRADQSRGMFQIWTSKRTGTYRFTGKKFLISFYKEHPSKLQNHVKELEKEVAMRKQKACSPYFYSALFEGKSDNNISFLLVNIADVE